jgi:1-acyl-sn-glycerol-3-phosphate acyltransferase
LKSIISIFITPAFYLVFGLLLVVFHPIQVICLNLISRKCHKRSVDLLNWSILKSLLILGSRSYFKGFEKIPENKPLIIVSNHQSLFDIPPIVWGFRKWKPKFLAKQGLGKFIPSISYNLRHGGSLLIDRSKGSQAIKDIFEYGKKIEAAVDSVVIFAEGTRSSTGVLKKFKPGGIEVLVKAMPNSVIIPLVIKDNFKIMRSGQFPLELGHNLNFVVLDPINPSDYPKTEIVQVLHDKIKAELES